MRRILKWIQRLLRWFFGPPIEQLPPEFGDSTPADLRRFEESIDQVHHDSTGNVAPSDTPPRGETKIPPRGRKNS
jgi:hypothetical protein